MDNPETLSPSGTDAELARDQQGDDWPVIVVDEGSPSRIDAEYAQDRRADNWSIIVIFGALLLSAVFFVSGWTVDF